MKKMTECELLEAGFTLEQIHDEVQEPEVSQLASGFGFDSDDEFNEYCDEMEAGIEG